MEERKDERPVIAVTMGDPAGIGPEITVKALLDPALYGTCRPLVVGDAAVLEYVSPKAARRDGSPSSVWIPQRMPRTGTARSMCLIREPLK